MIKNLPYRIEFWICVFFFVRLIGITNPPLESGHNWRQTTGLMVARNFMETDANILYPRIDDHNGGSGIIGMEFPVMNYIYFIISKIFGYTHWYGRLINLLVTSLGLIYFNKIIVRFFSTQIAFASTLFLVASCWFSYSRKMMPDTFCVSLIIIGLYYGLHYLENKKIRNLVIYIFLSSVAVLSKIPAALYFVLLIPLAIKYKKHYKHLFILALATLIPMLLVYYWYFIWNPHLSVTYGNWYNIGKPITEGFNDITGNMGAVLYNFYFEAFDSFIMFGIFLSGLVMLFIRKEKSLILVFSLFFIAFLVYMFKSGYYFYHHNYYIIPMVPVMALVAGYAVSLLNKKWIIIGILLVSVGEGIANQQHDFFIKDREVYKMDLEKIMDGISQKKDLIVINGNGNPQLIYLSHRKGWNCSDDQLYDKWYMENAVRNGCKFIVIHKHPNHELKLNYKIAFENDDFLIYMPGVDYRS